jgi:diacylglycerol kinase family enzyme
VRAVLIVNPNATSTTAAGRDLLAHALESRTELAIVHTDHRGHAIEIARDAAADDVDVLIVHGGDGTVNEVVNGVLRERGRDAGAPAVGVVPGGSANVFARALGMPRDPVEATGAILAALARRSSRLVGLGRADDRWFTFNAGMGWDASVVAAVEQQRASGREASPLRYAGTAVAEYLRQRRHPASMTIEVPGASPLEEVRLAFVSNTDPWTFLSGKAVRTNPGATFGSGLALFALRHLGLPTISRTLRHILSPDGDPHGRNVVRQDAVPSIRIRSAEPLALQLDGDHLGSRTDVEFVSVPGALRVVV